MFGNIGIGNWALHQGVNIWAVTSEPSMFSINDAT